MRSEDQLLSNKSTRRSRGLLFDNSWSSDRIIYGCLSSLAKNLPILKFCTRGIIRLIISWIEWNQKKLFTLLFIQNNLLKKKKIMYRNFLSDLLHSVHFREILSGYFLFSRFDWSIFVTQLVAKHMKEIIKKKVCGQRKIFVIKSFVNGRLIISTIKGTHSLHSFVL
jgi:hypothetical protein